MAEPLTLICVTSYITYGLQYWTIDEFQSSNNTSITQWKLL